MREVVIVSAVRTPIGTFGGTLKDTLAETLGTIAVKEAIKRAGIDVNEIDELLFGNVIQAGNRPNIARKISVNAGIPIEVPSMTINKLCGSALRCVSLGTQLIQLGDDDVVVCGGVESMTRAPYLNFKGRYGARMGAFKEEDSMLYDALFDTFSGDHMGITAENIADEWGLTREELDEFALASQQKAEAAIKAGKFKDEIVPVEIPQRKGDPKIFDTDEHPTFGSTPEKLAKLKPAFKKDGVVTAGNASGINDAAAAVVIMAKEKAEALGIKPMATIKGYGSAGCRPDIMGIGPVPATQKALEKAGWTMDDIDLIEANEAFAAQSLAVGKELDFNKDILNVNGGAIALGHPIGATGCRILVTLLYEMQKRDAKKGLATLCIGGGMGTALLVERD